MRRGTDPVLWPGKNQSHDQGKNALSGGFLEDRLYACRWAAARPSRRRSIGDGVAEIAVLVGD